MRKLIQQLIALSNRCRVISISAALPQPLLVPVMYPWRPVARGDGLQRVKRAWVIPPISVSENTRKIPLPLVQIKSDQLIPGEVIYSIKGPGVDEEPRGIFTIDADSGQVLLMTVLDREEKSSYKIKAYAVNMSGNPLEDPTDLEIIVIDQNDNRPVFDQQHFIGHVLEGSPPGTLVMQIAASDADDPQTDNAALQFSILGHSKGLFRIDPVTGEIRTVGVGLDRETISTYNLTLQVADLSGVGLANTASAIIFITDLNDNAPHFTASEFAVAVTEDTVGQEVGRVSVEDKDEAGTRNWLANYTIVSGNQDGHFSISTDPHTNQGIVLSLDYEAVADYSLTVTVQNWAELWAGASPSSQPSARVIITITDVNEPPRFQDDPRNLLVPEGSTAGTVLTVYTVTDPDREQQHNISYSIQYDPADWLLVDPETGEVVLRQVVLRSSPYLRHNRYTAIIAAVDHGFPPHTVIGTLNIHITEVNDFPPLLFPGAGTLCRGTGAGAGMLIWATDQDQEPHAEPFHFQLLPDSEPLHNWTITALNGWMTAWGFYQVGVRVSDSGEPCQEFEQSLNVTVCVCGDRGRCEAIAAAFHGSHVGVSLGAAIIILTSFFLLFLMVMVSLCWNGRRGHKALLSDSDSDIRDNVLNYDEQGGGEEDQEAYNLEQLRDPDRVFPAPARGKPPLRRDAPYNHSPAVYPRRPPADPSDIEDFINGGLDAADNDPNAPPYDMALIYDYEGEGSVAGTLSSLASASAEDQHDYDYLNDWGPRFRKLADMYGEH
uniref:Cadherin 15, type 1, M-cadherin (myotubule) n=1 Tax=Callorhinchus milii TaxID=7868 RepID=A0A4W3GTF8_CALMI